MTKTTGPAPATSAARTRAIKHQLRQLGLEPTIRSYRIGPGTAHTVFAADAQELELIADVLDALEWGDPVSRNHNGFVTLTIAYAPVH
jgi:3-oxoacyl-(acyl-carrier-protein) synthase